MSVILALGDSITDGGFNVAGGDFILTPHGGWRGYVWEWLTAAGYPPTMVGSISDVPPYGGHEGHRGYMTSEIQAIMPSIFGAVATPDIVIVLLGTNNLIGSLSTPATIASAPQEMRTILSTIRSYWPACQIIVVTIPPTGSGTNGLMVTYNAALVGVAAGQATLVSPAYVFATHIADGVHPTDAGYQLIATGIYGAIVALTAPTPAARTALPSTISLQADVSWDGSGLFTGTYDDVTTAADSEVGISIDEGRQGTQSLSPPAIGNAEIELINDDGRYSQERADSPIYQRVQPGRPVRYQVTHGIAGAYDEHDHYTEHTPYDGMGRYSLGQHVIDDISQTTEFGNRRVRLSTIGQETVLTRAQVTVGLMVAPLVSECFSALLDAVGWDDDLRDIAISDTRLLYWWCDTREPWNAMLELLQSEGPGTFGVRGDGTFYFENRNYRVTTPRSAISQAIFHDRSVGSRGIYDEHAAYTAHGLYSGAPDLWFTALQYEPGFKTVYNRATYTTRKRTTGSLTAVWSLGSDLVLSSGQVRTLIARPSDPFLGALTPVAPTDYTVAGGTVSVSLSVVSGLVAFITVTATSGTPTLTGLQLRAQPLTAGFETTVENGIDASESIAQFSPVPGADIPITLAIQGWSEISTDEAEAVCDAWVARQKIPRPQVKVVLRNADGTHLEQILRRQVSDRVTLQEANTGLDTDFWVNGWSRLFADTAGMTVSATMLLEQCDAVVGDLWDAPGALWDQARWGI